jgi:tRNA pseudouridine55 synthase
VPTRPKGRSVCGVLLLDKPRGLTSNHALQRVKRLFQAAKAGHTGSLDPLATGMLPICFGAATRLCSYLLDAGKSYRVVAELGAATTTGDAEGEIINPSHGRVPTVAEVAAVLRRFEGEIEQVPPMYSALKRGGVPLYRLARRGVSVPRDARRVVIDAIELEGYRWPRLELVVHCSKGTYIRTLIEDIAVAAGTAGHVQELRRLHVEPFRHNPMVGLETLEASAALGLEGLDRLLLPIDSALPQWSAVHVPHAAAARLAHGQALPAEAAWPLGRVKIYAPANELIALGEVTADQRLVPIRVFIS